MIVVPFWLTGSTTAAPMLPFRSESLCSESLSATEAPPVGCCVYEARTASMLPVLWKESCAAWLSVSTIATIAAALKRGANL